MQTHLDELSERIAREQARVVELEQMLPGLENADTETVESGRRMGEARTRIEERAAEVGALRTDSRCGPPPSTNGVSS